MKTRAILFLVVVACVGCEKPPGASTGHSAEQRVADERRLAELRELEARAAQREADARAAAENAGQEQLARDREKVERERSVIAERERAAEASARLAAQELTRAADLARDATRRSDEARAEQKIEFFYDALDAHGDWIELEKYGYCWQPQVARNARWRPYTDGSWVWTDYGWTWDSNETFGWATYHYGRWAHLRRIGWVWVPGSEWAPAWVAWRRSDEHIGWAPLPPDAHSGSGFTAAVDSYFDIGPASYTFVPVQSFGEPTYLGRVVESERNAIIINKTVNVTRISYRQVENKTVIFNEGPDVLQIEARTRQPVRRVRLERVSQAPKPTPTGSKGSVLQILAPLITSAPRPTTAPAKVKERASARDIDRGWSDGADPRGIEQARAQLSREARAAEETQRSGKEAPVVRRDLPAARIEPRRAPDAKLTDEAHERPNVNRPSDTDRAAETREVPPAGGVQRDAGKDHPKRPGGAATQQKAESRDKPSVSPETEGRGDLPAQRTKTAPAERPATTPLDPPAVPSAVGVPASAAPTATPRVQPSRAGPSAEAMPPQPTGPAKLVADDLPASTPSPVRETPAGSSDKQNGRPKKRPESEATAPAPRK